MHGPLSREHDDEITLPDWESQIDFTLSSCTLITTSSAAKGSSRENKHHCSHRLCCGLGLRDRGFMECYGSHGHALLHKMSQHSLFTMSSASIASLTSRPAAMMNPATPCVTLVPLRAGEEDGRLQELKLDIHEVR